MQDSDLIKYAKAFLLAVERHNKAGQTREDNVTPYWVHPLRVVERLKSVGITDWDLLSAAVLHDVVEDTDVTLNQLSEQLGPRVSKLVDEVSQKPNQPDEEYIAQLRASSRDGQTIKLADKWDNVNELRRMKYPTYGNKSPVQYLDEAKRTLEACREANIELAAALAKEIELATNAFKQQV